MGEPRATAWPAPTEASTGSYVVRRPSAWSMLTTGRPATIPAKATVPSPAASTGAPTDAARSTPRCPAAYGVGGGSNRPVTAPPANGSTQRVAGRVAEDDGCAGGGTAAAAIGANTAVAVSSAASRRTDTA